MRVGKLIRLYRSVQEIGVREMAKEIGISSATLSRLENGKSLDQSNMLKVINWFFVNPNKARGG